SCCVLSSDLLSFPTRRSSDLHSRLLHEEWERYVEQPFRAAGAVPPALTTLPSPYRFIIVPLVQYILELSEKHPARHIVLNQGNKDRKSTRLNSSHEWISYAVF